MTKQNKGTTVIAVLLCLSILLIAAGFIMQPYDTTIDIDNTDPQIYWIGPNTGLQTNTFDILFNVCELSYMDLGAEEVYTRFVHLTVDGNNVTLPEVDVGITQSEADDGSSQGGPYCLLTVRVWDYVVETGYHDINVDVTDLAGNSANSSVSIQTWAGTVKGDVYFYDSDGYEIPEGGYVGGTIYIRFVPTEGEDQIESIKLRIFSKTEIESVNTMDASGVPDIDFLLQNDWVGITYIMPVTAEGWYEQPLDTKTLADGTYYIYILVEDKTGGFSTYSVLEYNSVNGNPGPGAARPNNMFLVIIGTILLVMCIIGYVFLKRREAKKFAYGGY